MLLNQHLCKLLDFIVVGFVDSDLSQFHFGFVTEHHFLDEEVLDAVTALMGASTGLIGASILRIGRIAITNGLTGSDGLAGPNYLPGLNGLARLNRLAGRNDLSRLNGRVLWLRDRPSDLSV
jgi:hypothetical protein